MWMIAGWLAWLGAGSPAGTAGGHDRFAEPPLEFALELDGQETDAVEGETRRVTVGGRTVEASFTVKPTRLLRTRDLSFRFPREFDFAHDEGGSWKLTRDADMIVLARIEDAAALPEALEAGVGRLKENLAAEVKPASIRLGGRTVQGRSGHGGKGRADFVFELFTFPVGKVGYLLLRSEVHPSGGATHPATVLAWKTLTESFTFAAATGPEDQAPFEFTVTLDGSPFDLAERQARTLTAGGATWKARVLQKDMRTLRAPDVTLRYPFAYEFKGEVAEDGTDVWSMDGGDQLVMLVRLRSGAEAAKAVQSNIDIMAADMGKPATRSVETTFAQAKRKGTEAEFKKGDMTVVADFFPFTAGGSGYLLVITQSSQGGEVPPIYRLARQSIEKSVTILR
jgi:hypothetical protein